MTDKKYTTESGAHVHETEDVGANEDKANAGFTWAALHHGETLPLMNYVIAIKGILPANVDEESINQIMDEMHETVSSVLSEKVVEVLDRWAAGRSDVATNIEVEARAYWSDNPVKGEGGMN